MKRHVVGGVLSIFVMAIAFVGTAQADTLDLTGSNFVLAYNPMEQVDVSYDYNGFHLYGNGYIGDRGWSAEMTTVDPDNALYVAMHSASPFTFNGASLSKGSGTPPYDLGIEGWLNGKEVYFTGVSLSDTPKYFNIGFVNVDELRFRSHHEGFFVSDFTYSWNDSPSPVPEPSIFLVLAGGLVGIVCLRKRIAA